MARIEFDIREGTVVARYEVIGTQVYWNAVVHRGHHIGHSVGGNTSLPDGINVGDILQKAVRDALIELSTQPARHRPTG